MLLEGREGRTRCRSHTRFKVRIGIRIMEFMLEAGMRVCRRRTNYGRCIVGKGWLRMRTRSRTSLDCADAGDAGLSGCA